MITIKLSGGLGNQMFQYALGKTLATSYGTDLILDKSFIENRFPQKSFTFRTYELDVFGIQEKLSGLTIFLEKFPLLNHVIHPLIWKIGQRIRYGSSYIAEKNGLPIIKIGDNSYLDGYWQSYRYFEKSEDLVRKIFEVRTPMDTTNMSILGTINSSYEDSVSVHVRRGDYVTNNSANAWHGICSVGYYKSGIEYMKEELRSPHFFVFSDDIEWVRANIDFGEQVTFIDNNGAKGHEDLRLMYSCAHHIIANSSFSWWGAFLGRNKEKIVIAPSKWLSTTEYSVSELIPNNWIKI